MSFVGWLLSCGIWNWPLRFDWSIKNFVFHLYFQADFRQVCNVTNQIAVSTTNQGKSFHSDFVDIFQWMHPCRNTYGVGNPIAPIIGPQWSSGTCAELTWSNGRPHLQATVSMLTVGMETKTNKHMDNNYWHVMLGWHVGFAGSVTSYITRSTDRSKDILGCKSADIHNTTRTTHCECTQHVSEKKWATKLLCTKVEKLNAGKSKVEKSGSECPPEKRKTWKWMSTWRKK